MTNLEQVGSKEVHEFERKRFDLDSSPASGTRWKAVGWRQKRSKKLKSKKLTETPYSRSIKQLRWPARTFLGQH